MPKSFKGGLIASVDLSESGNIGKVFRREVFHPVDGAYTLVFRATPAKDRAGNPLKDFVGRPIYLHEGFAVKRPISEVAIRQSQLDKVHRFVEPFFHQNLDSEKADRFRTPKVFLYDERDAFEYHHEPNAPDVIPTGSIQADRNSNPTAFSERPVVDWRDRIVSELNSEAAEKKTSHRRTVSKSFRDEQRKPIRGRASGNSFAMLLIGGSVLIGGAILLHEFQKRRQKIGREAAHDRLMTSIDPGLQTGLPQNERALSRSNLSSGSHTTPAR